MGHRRFYDSLLCPQVVGNLLYYRFLNPAVVAPDAFDIVAMAAGGALAAPQRHALGAVAQVLQHAAAGKAFSRESQHLRVLNDYLEETHLKFRSWPQLPVPLCFLFLLPTEFLLTIGFCSKSNLLCDTFQRLVFLLLSNI